MKKNAATILCALYAFTAAMLMFGQNGSAYIDPSVMTYVIQAVAGVVIAVGAVVGVYWRKTKKKMQEKLGMEEKKETESDEIIVKDEGKEAENADENK